MINAGYVLAALLGLLVLGCVVQEFRRGPLDPGDRAAPARTSPRAGAAGDGPATITAERITVDSLQTREARTARNIDQGALRQHDLTCLTCRQGRQKRPRGPRCPAGRTLAEALEQSTVRLRREVDQDRAPHPDQGELFT
jgi:hypothetical protein